ncbi:MAG: TetR/AcrR family transcriptional regulator [Actinomycetota bacterium]
MKAKAIAPLTSPRAGRTRAAILRAASRRFGADGFAGVSMDELAAEAGVTKPTIYAHFGSKEALFETLIGDVIATSNGGVMAMVETVDEVGEALFALASDRLDWLLSDDIIGLMRAASAEAIRRPDWAKNLLAGFDVGAMERWLTDLDAAGVLSVDSPATASAVFAALTKGALFYPVLVAGQPITPKPERDALTREAVRIFLAAHSPVP